MLAVRTGWTTPTLVMFAIVMYITCVRTWADDALPSGVEKLTAPGMENLYQLSDRVFSGGQPEGEEAFAALEKLGVTTIISVDGSQPNVSAAAAHNLRYIHLPIGYEGISTQRQAELVKALQTSPGKVFVHCHHGKHRGPAAAAVLCEAAGTWSPAIAAQWLKVAGTSSKYLGLWSSVREFKAPSAKALRDLPDGFPSSVKPPDIVQTMIAIDNAFDSLLKFNAAKPGSPAEKNIRPLDEVTRKSLAHEALQLEEAVREWLRSPEYSQRTAGFQKNGDELLAACESLTKIADRSDDAKTKLSEAISLVETKCTQCHAAHRN